MIASSSMCRIFEQSGLSGGPSYPASVAASNVPAHPLLLSCETINRAYGTRSLFTICRSDYSKEAVSKKILPIASSSPREKTALGASRAGPAMGSSWKATPRELA